MSGLRIIPPLAALLWLTTAAAPVNADGPGAYRPAKPRPALPAPLSEQSAIDAYTLGYAAIQRADHSQALAEASSSDAEKEEAQRAARGFYKESLGHFQEAIRLDGSMHEAYTYLGYAHRKLGNHAEALAAYEQALRIFPDYPHAIEYQGQAYLGMKRLEEARFNYLRLYALNKGQAAKLLQAMRAWVEAHRSEAETNDFAEWVARRSEITRGDVPSSSW
ncbi:tetratricopeptide repeat protein [Steroidobacter sp. S1-65]|uniref:Tetratricopeptide repeat protein n=1 Tax=Steroidobacter gossypii TaxID=2805490 RepID=A0ABS1X2A5_9GAMM|nr:tetratricopeptide repeat protein [Steroidobacter gossypii]MBM0107350.1 tetratricopeptide repeat protein [Steroidobacter gossypii]